MIKHEQQRFFVVLIMQTKSHTGFDHVMSVVPTRVKCIRVACTPNLSRSVAQRRVVGRYIVCRSTSASTDFFFQRNA